MTWAEYIFNHLIPTWFHSFGNNFRMWADLMTGNYENYALLKDDDPFQECYEWFWGSLCYDDTLDKSFLEHIRKLAKEVELGEVRTYSLDEVLKELETDDEGI